MPKLSEPRGRPTKIDDTTICPLRKKCIIKGCSEEATSWFPLLPGGPAFCSKHHYRATEYGADLTPFDPEDPRNQKRILVPRVINRRKEGIPKGSVYVGRPSKWGNPMTVRELRELFPNDTEEELNQKAVDWYRDYLKVHPEFLEETVKELAGKDLVCWCAPLPCHADVLLELANLPCPQGWLKKVDNSN